MGERDTTGAEEIRSHCSAERGGHRERVGAPRRSVGSDVSSRNRLRHLPDAHEFRRRSQSRQPLTFFRRFALESSRSTLEAHHSYIGLDMFIQMGDMSLS